MTMEEACRRYQIDQEELRCYERTGLLACNRTEDGHFDYQQADLQRAGFIHSLLETGFQIEELKQFLQLFDQAAGTGEEQIRILKKRRYQLLDDIHQKQQMLDRLDYLIHNIKLQ